MSQESKIQAGTELGRYQLIKQLAVGGMAEIWLARSSGAHGFLKTVVLKTILPHLADDPNFTELFINEARLAATLNHPNIIQIFDLGKIEEHYFIAMEFVTGRTLRQLKLSLLLKKRVPPPWLVFRTALSVCNALEYAHHATDEQGNPLQIVHRDVTPENVMISFTGVTKVFDFGIAKATVASGNKSSPRWIGKYGYLSPEQVESSGRFSDSRTDIYSLGIMLYELLTGARPFRASNEKTLLSKILNETPRPPSSLASWVSSTMDDIVMRAIAKRPDDRYQKVADLRGHVEDYLASLASYPTEQYVAKYLRHLFEVEDVGDSYYTPLNYLNVPSAPVDGSGPIVEQADGQEVLLDQVEPTDPIDLKPDGTADPNEGVVTNSFSGRFSGIDLFDFVQLMLASRRKALLELYSRDNDHGLLYVDAGNIVHATSGALQGRDAVYHCLAFEGGNFSIQPWRDPAQQTIDVRGDFLLLEAARRKDEGRQQAPSMGDSGELNLDALDPEAKEVVEANRSDPGKAPGTPDDSDAQVQRHAWDRLLQRLDKEDNQPEDIEPRAKPAPVQQAVKSPEERAVARFEEGLMMVREREFNGALEAWTKAVELDPANRSYQINLNRLRKQMQDKED